MIICTNFNDQISISKAKEKMQMILVFLVLLIDTAKKMFFSHSSHLWLFCCPMDCSPPGSSVNGILQAKILEWVAIPFSRGPSWPRNWTWKWQPTLVLLPRKFHAWRSLVGYSPWGHKESDMTEWLHNDFLHCRQILYHLSHQESPVSC